MSFGLDPGILRPMTAPSPAASPIPRLQQALAATDLDGWLIYDFRGLNPHAGRVLELPPQSFLTRRFFVYVPREGRATVLHHHIEGGTWRAIAAGWGAELRAFGSHTELDTELRALVAGRRLALEYSPRGEVPAVSRVDAGTAERLHAAGAAELRSSADLLQQFLVWSPEDLAAHTRAVLVLSEAKDAAFALMHDRLRAGEAVGEFEVQTLIMERLAAAGLESGHPVNVSFGVNAADSHYEPGEGRSATLGWGQCVLIDLWGQEPGRPYADMTWVGHAGEPGAEYLAAWEAVRRARDAALELLRARFAAEGWGRLQGWELDRAARGAMGAPWAEHFLHRTGHDLGVQIHGPGANLDDYETHDTRTLTPGLAVTVEPGTYPAERGFGLRTEVDVFLGADGPHITTPVQARPFVLGRGEWVAVRAAGAPGALLP